MNKRIRNVLRVLGCIILSTSMLLSSCRSAKKEGRKKMTKKTTESTEMSETTDDPSDTDPSDSSVPTDTTAPVAKKYTGAEASKKLHELDEEIFKNSLSDLSDMGDKLEDPSKYGLDWPDVGLSPWSPDNDDEAREFDAYVLQTLEEIDGTSLELEDQILLDTMLRDYHLASDMAYMDYYTSAFNTLTGLNVELPITFALTIFDDQADVERYLKILADVKPFYESLFEYEKIRTEQGKGRPDDLLDKLIESVKTVYENHDGNYMYTTFEERVNELDLDDAVKKDLIARNKEILDTSFFPAYEELAKNLETLRGKTSTSGKLCEMDGGKEFYEKYFQLRSGTDLTIDEAKKLLEQTVQAEYLDFYSKMMMLSQEQSTQLMDMMEGKYNITTGSFEKDIEFCKEAIKSDFPDIGDVKYKTAHLPKEMSENFSPAAYWITPIDDINKNILLVNDNSTGLGNMLTTVGHEAFPGHLYETVYHMQKMNSFYQKGGSTAYKEGWSTYSEDYIMNLTTDFDMAVYECYYVYIIMLNYHMEAYIDICINYDGWTKDDVIKYGNQYFPGAGAEIADFFYDRSIEIPCYVMPYCFGNYFCCKIINDAMAQYGNEYTKSEIHAAYLDMGPSSFEILEKYMPAFVEKQH